MFNNTIAKPQCYARGCPDCCNELPTNRRNKSNQRLAITINPTVVEEYSSTDLNTDNNIYAIMSWPFFRLLFRPDSSLLYTFIVLLILVVMFYITNIIYNKYHLVVQQYMTVIETNYTYNQTDIQQQYIPTLVDITLGIQRGGGPAMPNYALHSLGAYAIKGLTTTSYNIIPSNILSTLRCIFHYCHPPNSPDITLTPGTEPGMCWCFAGDKGQLGVHLSEVIRITHITIDHPSISIAQHIGSAPKHMELWGQPEGKSKQDIYIMAIAYNIYADMPIQTFAIPDSCIECMQPVKHVVLYIKDNWGYRNYTCLYRLMVHGHTVV